MSLNNDPPLILVPYQSSWPHAFKEEAQKLKKVFSSLPSHFYHIGSTSIPGCSAKPIVDILGVVADVTRVDDFNAALFELGFEPLGEYGMIQRRFFRKRSGIQVNVHVFEDTDPEVERHLRFCDYLRRHPDEVKAYCELKSKLAEQFALDRDRYTLGKDKFIKTVDIAAAKEADRFFAIPLKNPERKKSWTLHEIIEAMEANKHLHMTSFTKYIPAIERVFETDVTVVRSEIPSDTFNYILDAHFTSENALKRVAHVLELYRSAQLPFSWWLAEGDTPKELESVLMAQGLKFKEGNIGMYLDLDLFTPPTKLAPMQFVRAMKTSELRDFSRVIVAVGEDPKAFDQLYSKIPPILYGQGSNLKMTIGYAEGVPVGIGILLLHANVAGLYYIATVPAEQKKGYGTAMMVHLLERAKARGFHRAVLQASTAGINLYQRLGFQECCRFKEYSF